MLRSGLFAILSCFIAMFAQKPLFLQSGQQVTLHGTLLMRPAGRLQFVALGTVDAYLPMVQGQATSATHELGLSNFNHYDLLYAHRGQVVTVNATVMTNGASPYYLHNVSLKLSSIRLADGTELLGSVRARPRITMDVGQYQASVLLPADLAAPWRYVAHGRVDAEEQFLACSSNGGGDVVNCSCARGFGVLDAESSTRGVDARVLTNPHMAQFGVGDAQRRIDLSVTCTR